VTDPRERLDEYVDGLLDEEGRREVEDAAERDPAFAAELARVQGFAALLDDLPCRRRRRRRVAALTVAATAVVVVALVAGTRGSHRDTTLDEVAAEWVEFGRRLGRITAERRAGSVPRLGFGVLEIPPARASGIVFLAALEELGVALPSAARDAALDAVRDHAVAMRALPRTVAGEAARAEAALRLYRRLRGLVGTAVADAYYDVFRPGLADARTVARVDPGSLAAVAAERYVAEYRQTLDALARRYGRGKVQLVLDRLAPGDVRRHEWDAADDGVGRDAVLAIRADLYRAAAAAGAEKLFIDPS
jgi:hypothetical protein